MKKRRKPLILLGFPAEFLAFPRWFEHPTYRLGGGRSIQLSYGNIFKIYSILVLNLLNVNRLCPKGGRYNIFLGEAPLEGHFWLPTNPRKSLILLAFQHIPFFEKNAFFIIFLSKIEENVFPDYDFHASVQPFVDSFRMIS